MGQRANLAIRTVKGYELYYSHWCANTLTTDLFWGVDHARAFILSQRRVEPTDGWLDSVWAEGGAVLDLENKTLLLYGGEDLLYDVPLRRLYLKFLSHVWQGWTVRWAQEGIVEIAEYLGVDRQKIIAQSDNKDNKIHYLLTAPEERNWVSGVGSIKSDGGLCIFASGSTKSSFQSSSCVFVISALFMNYFILY